MHTHENNISAAPPDGMRLSSRRHRKASSRVLILALAFVIASAELLMESTGSAVAAGSGAKAGEDRNSRALCVAPTLLLLYPPLAPSLRLYLSFHLPLSPFSLFVSALSCLLSPSPLPLLVSFCLRSFLSPLPFPLPLSLFSRLLLPLLPRPASVMAVEEINGVPSILPDHLLHLTVQNYSIASLASQLAAFRLLENHPVAVIGPHTSDQAARFSPLAAATQVPFISPSATDVQLTQGASRPFFELTNPTLSCPSLCPLHPPHLPHQVPFISASATDVQLTQGGHRPYFLRAVPSDGVQMAAMAGVCASDTFWLRVAAASSTCVPSPLLHARRAQRWRADGRHGRCVPRSFCAMYGCSTCSSQWGQLIKRYKWQQVALIYSDDRFGRNGMAALALQLLSIHADAEVAVRVAIPTSATGEAIHDQMSPLLLLDMAVYVLHASPSVFSAVIEAAPPSKCNPNPLHPQIFRPLNPSIYTSFPSSQRPLPYKPSPYALPSHDAVTLIARALHSLLYPSAPAPTNSSSHEPPQTQQQKVGQQQEGQNQKVGQQRRMQQQEWEGQGFQQLELPVLPLLPNGTQDVLAPPLTRLQQSAMGPALRKALLKTSFDGLQGRCPHYQVPSLPGALITRCPHYQVPSLPGALITRCPHYQVPSLPGALITRCPHYQQYKEYVNVSDALGEGNSRFSGYCVEVFRLAVTRLPYELDYEFVLYGDKDLSYTQLVLAVANKTYDAAVGDITVLDSRSKVVFFTYPIQQSRLGVMGYSRPYSNPWMVFSPFTASMWAVTAAICITTGLFAMMLDRHMTPDFQGMLQKRIVTAVWYGCHTVYSIPVIRIHTTLARAVVVTWLLLSFIIVDTYVASLTSILTMQRLLPQILDIYSALTSNSPIGYQQGSFVHSYLLQLGVAPQDHHPSPFPTFSLSLLTTSKPHRQDKLVPLTGESEYASSLSSGRVAVIVDEDPYLDLFSASFCDGVQASQPFSILNLAFVGAHSGALWSHVCMMCVH
ncbi:unnamed protein product [Closterium sp. Naga37s-1]|nr:unnamed protein product [Closterium sp. Naga37s-1]